MESRASARAAKSALLALLQAPMGDIRITHMAVARLRGDPPRFMRLAWLPAVREVLRGKGEPLDIHIHTLTVSALDTVIVVEGPLGHLIALQMFALLRLVGRETVHRCECGQLFVRAGKRRFCSTRCQKRVYMRRLRAGDAGTE